MGTSIADFQTSFYIPVIQNLAFQLPNTLILGTNHCHNARHEAFKLHRSNQDVFCCCDYSERVVASLAHQIKS